VRLVLKGVKETIEMGKGAVEETSVSGGFPERRNLRRTKCACRTRRTWTHKEDMKLKELVETTPEPFEWSDIASQIPNRNAKQCRERWRNNLAPTVKISGWTMEEDELICRSQLTSSHRNKWTLIARKCGGRSGDHVKIRFKSIVRAASHIWTPEEDKNLLELAQFCGRSNLDAFANSLQGRSKNAIQNRLRLIISLQASPDVEVDRDTRLGIRANAPEILRKPEFEHLIQQVLEKEGVKKNFSTSTKRHHSECGEGAEAETNKRFKTLPYLVAMLDGEPGNIPRPGAPKTGLGRLALAAALHESNQSG